MSHNQKDNEYFKRSGFDACRIDDRLIKEVVDQLGKSENRNKNCCECPEVYIKSDRGDAGVLQYEAKYCTQRTAEQRSDIRDYIEDAGKYCDADGCVESESCDKKQAKEVDQCDSEYLQKHSDEIS